VFRQAKLSPLEAIVWNRATRFYATAFRGRGVYDRMEAASFDEAVAAAQSLYEGDRGVMIYAYDDGGRFAMLGSWQP
jgi:hypothetical protein